MKHGIGEPIPRYEDGRLLTGRGRYSDDMNRAGQAYAFVLRSLHGHAWIRAIDSRAASAAAGVLTILTAADYLGDGLGSMPQGTNPLDALDPWKQALVNRDGTKPFVSPHIPLAVDKVRHVGEPVAIVVAESAHAAQDAAELIEVDYEPLPSVIDVCDAVKPDAPRIWDDAPGNVAVDAEWGDAGATAEAFATAAHVVEMDFRHNRVVNGQMEPRAAVAEYDSSSKRYTLYAGSQSSHRLKLSLARALNVPDDSVRVMAWDVGGGYGPRLFMYSEYTLIAWAARRLGRPVKWVSTRSDGFISDYQARDQFAKAAIALDEDGRIKAMRCEILYNVGGITVAYVPLANGTRLVTSVYDIPLLYLRAKAVITNTVPTAPYRGAGRPESMHNIERLLDAAAEKIGIDRVEVRRRNLIPKAAIPYTNPMGIPYDSGDFAGCLDRVVALHDWAGFAKRKKGSKARGWLRGIGLGMYVEIPVGARDEWAAVEIKPDDAVDFLSGSLAQGQGHETTFRQVICTSLGVPFDSIRMYTGDTDVIPVGGGTHSDRSMRLSGALIVWNSEEIIRKGKQIASHLLETAVDDIEFEDRKFRVRGTDRSLDLFEAARRALTDEVPQELRGPLKAQYHLERRLPAYPTGAAICEVEIDPETGRVGIVGWSCVDDVGRVINPLIVHGQVHGGIAQGVGQAMLENAVYDGATGQLIAGSFLDYCMPRADDLPVFNVETYEVLAPSNPLGVKGAGEAGTTPALAAFINAVVDALREYGVKHIAMPVRSEDVWRAIHHS
jgi:carbon-monoxide dehydrogenase large subunit